VDQPASVDEVTSSPERDAHMLRNGIIWTAALLVLALAIGLAVPDLRNVLDRMSEATPGWLVLAVGLELASCLGYVATVRLVLHRGPARQVRHLAWAEMAFGAVVPVGGAGGLAVGAWAMRAWRIPWSRIVNRSAVIFLLTSAVNVIVLGLAGVGVLLGLGMPAKPIVYGLVPAAVGFGALGLFLLLGVAVSDDGSRTRDGRLRLIMRRTAAWVRDSEAIIRGADWRLLGTVGYLVLDIAVLWACLRAVGTAPPVFAIVVGYQVGYLANLLPIPGGVGVLEGGLLGALLLYGLPAAPTAAAVVLYHAIALWIPVLGGTIGFARLRGAVTSPPESIVAAREAAAQAEAQAQAGQADEVRNLAA
jgi:uncharacterized membrane protein YbhN (UPF0104 family)